MTLSQATKTALIQMVRLAARAEIMPRFRKITDEDITAKASAIDVVTEADLAMEAVVAEQVPEILPDALVIGEEGIAADPSRLAALKDAELAVIIDPIDGTWNFANGIAVFGVILAVVVRGETVFGLLYDPVMDDWVEASRGQGAWFCTADGHRERLSVATGKPFAEACGVITHYLFPKEQQPRLAQGMVQAARVTALCCSCHDYRLLAQGRIDFVQAVGLNAWDHAAGVLAVTEAGGYCRMLDGGAYLPTLTEGVLTSASTAGLLDETVAAFGLHEFAEA